jgi:hypothetical protein
VRRHKPASDIVRRLTGFQLYVCGAEIPSC